MFIQKSTVLKRHVLSNCQHIRVTMTTLLTPVRHALSMLPSKIGYIKSVTWWLGSTGWYSCNFCLLRLLFYLSRVCVIDRVSASAVERVEQGRVRRARLAARHCRCLARRRHCVYKTLERRPLVDSFMSMSSVSFGHGFEANLFLKQYFLHRNLDLFIL